MPCNFIIKYYTFLALWQSAFSRSLSAWSCWIRDKSLSADNLASSSAFRFCNQYTIMDVIPPLHTLSECSVQQECPVMYVNLFVQLYTSYLRPVWRNVGWRLINSSAKPHVQSTTSKCHKRISLWMTRHIPGLSTNKVDWVRMLQLGSTYGARAWNSTHSLSYSIQVR